MMLQLLGKLSSIPGFQMDDLVHDGICQPAIQARIRNATRRKPVLLYISRQPVNGSAGDHPLKRQEQINNSIILP